MADARELDELGLWPPPRHRLGGFAGEEIRLRAAQKQRRTADRLPSRPEIDILKRARL